MKYDPHMALELNFTEEEVLAYQLVCAWVDLTQKLLPTYTHQKIARTGNIRKSIVFKHMLKFVRENNNKFKGFQFIIFMRAQLEIAKKLISEGKRVLVDVSLLHGEKAHVRWAVWKKLITKNRQTQKAVYSYGETSLTAEFDKTFKTIMLLLGEDITIEKYTLESPNILKFTILKRISPLYVLCSKWIQKLSDPIKTDILFFSNVENLKDFDLSKIEIFYNKYFNFEN